MKSASKIMRISDGKVFSCYFRNGPILPNLVNERSWWISNDNEELELTRLNTAKYQVLEYVGVNEEN